MMDKQSETSSTSVLYKAFYFVFYAGYISFLLYVPVYFKYLGLSAIYVGLLNGIRPLMQTIGAPLWGIVGDRYRIRRAIFVAAFVVMIVKTMLFLLFRPHNEICIVTRYDESMHIVKNSSFIIKHDIKKRSFNKYNETKINKTASFAKPPDVNRIGPILENDKTTLANHIVPNIGELKDNTRPIVSANVSLHLEDHSVFRKDRGSYVKYTTVHDQDEIVYIFVAILLLIVFGDPFDAAVFTLADTSCLDTLGGENYGYYRLWGSAGWGVVTPIIGFVINHFTTEKCGLAVGAYVYIFYFYLGFMYLALLFGSHFEFTYEHSDLVNKTVKSTLLNFHYGMFLFVTFYAGFCYGFLLYFVNWFIDSLGGSALIMGTATACKSIVDVAFFFLSARVIETLGHLNTVTISLMAYICAFVSYSYIANPWFAIPIEVVHSGAYALVWSSSVSYLNKAAPAGSSATVQGILQGVYWGLGTGGGTIIGGYVVHVFGFVSTFRAFAVVTSIILFVFLANRLITTKLSNLEEEDDDKSTVSLCDRDNLDSDGGIKDNIPIFQEVGDDHTGKEDNTEVEKVPEWKDPLSSN